MKNTNLEYFLGLPESEIMPTVEVRAKIRIFNANPKNLRENLLAGRFSLLEDDETGLPMLEVLEVFNTNCDSLPNIG